MRSPSNENWGISVDDGVGAKVSVADVVAVAGTGGDVGALVGLGVIVCCDGTASQATSRMIRTIPK